QPELMNSSTFQAYSKQRQALMVQTAYRYLRFQHRRDKRTEDVARRSFALLHEMNELPAPPDPEPTRKSPPESGHDSHMLAIAGGRYDSTFFGDISYRF